MQIQIEGMSCTACANRIERVLHKNGVRGQVNFASQTAEVESDNLEVHDILKLIQKAGFQASIEQKAPAKTSNLKLLEKVGLGAGSFVAIVDMGGMLFGVMNPAGVATSAILTTICQFTVGLPFLKRALISLKHFSPGMDFLVSLGTLSAWSLSMAIWLHVIHAHHVWFEASASVLVLIRLGKILEENARNKASMAMQELSRELPENAKKVQNGELVEVLATSLKAGDTILVLQHENVPVDGIIKEGVAEINESLFTGESFAVLKESGSAVLAGSLNVGPQFFAKVTQTRGNCRFDAMLKAVERAQNSRAPVQDLADAISRWFVPLVVLIALSSAVWVQFLGGSLEEALIRMITVLVVSCPCALGLATPTAITAGIGRAAELGILVREARSLQLAENLKFFCLDKTGTLTEGKPVVKKVLHAPDYSSEEILMLASSLEQSSTHPLGKAILAANTQKIPMASEVVNTPGKGLSGIVNGQTLTLGKPEFVFGSKAPSWADDFEDHVSLVALSVNQVAAGLILIADPLRQESELAISSLKSLGIEPVLISGDRQKAVEEVARTTGITAYYFAAQPEEKLRLIKEFQNRGTTAMIGDGVNDSLALAQADFSISMGDGSAAARESADLTLTQQGLMRIITAIHLSRQIMHTIRRNLFFAFSYNLVVIPMAVMGKLHPGIAGGMMALSSILVVLSSLQLRGWKAGT